MNLSEYALNKGGSCTIGCPVLACVAAAAECSAATLYMIAKGHKKASAKLANRIQTATRMQVTVHELRPDLFGPAPASSRKRRPAQAAGEVADAA